MRDIFQRINHLVFKNPVALMENISRVTRHLAGKSAGTRDQSRRALSLILACDGKPFHHGAADNCWRVYRFIEQTRTYGAVQSPAQAFEAAGAFGRFPSLLGDLPAPRLHDTIQDFQRTSKRFRALEHATAADTVNRAALAKPEIAFALRQNAMTSVLVDANPPEHVTHNDTQFNNVMLDLARGGYSVPDGFDFQAQRTRRKTAIFPTEISGSEYFQKYRLQPDFRLLLSASLAPQNAWASRFASRQLISFRGRE